MHLYVKAKISGIFGMYTYINDKIGTIKFMMFTKHNVLFEYVFYEKKKNTVDMTKLLDSKHQIFNNSSNLIELLYYNYCQPNYLLKKNKQ